MAKGSSKKAAAKATTARGAFKGTTMKAAKRGISGRMMLAGAEKAGIQVPKSQAAKIAGVGKG